MSKQAETIGKAMVVVGVTALIVAIAQANPNCDRGCKNNFQHLFQHVLDDAIGGLLT